MLAGRIRTALLSSILILASIALNNGSYAQFQNNFEPRQVLSQVISAFQNGGPPQVYTWFGPQLYQTVYMQTNGSGFYPPLRQLGPVTGMQVTGQQQLPAGPVYAIRARHQSGQSTDWYIGFGQFTNKIEYLNFQFVNQGQPVPDINKGPDPDNSGGGAEPPTPTPGGDGCDLYPAMCQR